MAISIRPYTEEWIPAVKAFNQRLATGGVPSEFHFPEKDVPSWLPKRDGRRIYQEFYLALEGQEVRGAFILKTQDFSVRGKIQAVANYDLPISEGIINKRYSSVGVHMLRSAAKAAPLLYCLGMGGFDRPLPQMLMAMGWNLHAVPFYFRVHHPANFLRQIAPLRQTPGRRFLADLAALTGTGWIGINILQRFHAARHDQFTKTELAGSFGNWADELWEQCHSHYMMIGSRNSTSLNILYPTNKNFLCLKVTRDEEVVGWVVMLETKMQNNKYFGCLRVGSIADCLASPENAGAVIQAATRFLEDRGVDLIVSNQSHVAWTEALKSAGFLKGPSNFIVATSKPLSQLIFPFESNQNQLFFMRGDGDGPVNL